MDNVANDQDINLQTPVDAPKFTPPICEEYFVKERDHLVQNCNNDRGYRYQAFSQSGGGSFIGYTLM